MHEATASRAEMLDRIDLSDYSNTGIRVISGRSRGEKVRSDACVERLDDNLDAHPNGYVAVVVPDSVVYVASSFYLGLFGPSIRRFGEEGFRMRYRFEGPYSEKNLKDSIQEAINRGNQEAVKSDSPIPAVS